MYVSHKVNDMYCSITYVHLMYYTPTQATKTLVQICFAAALNVKLSLIEQGHIDSHKKVLIFIVQPTWDRLGNKISSSPAMFEGSPAVLRCNSVAPRKSSLTILFETLLPSL